jgi:hypothetical protein
MKLIQPIGDSREYVIPLRKGNSPFAPSSDWTLVFTVKLDPTNQDDAAALFQKATSGYGLTVDGSSAKVVILRADTKREDTGYEAAAGDYFWDIQAVRNSGPDQGEVSTVANGTFTLTRDVTRNAQPSQPIVTTEDPVPLLKGDPGDPGTTDFNELDNVPSTFPPTIGSGPADAVAGNDPRLTDARTPTAHTHPSTEISDSTNTGRSLLTAADAAAARTTLQLGNAALATTSTGGNGAADDGKIPAYASNGNFYYSGALVVFSNAFTSAFVSGDMSGSFAWTTPNASGTLALTASTSGIPDNLVTSSTKTTPIDADSVLITDSESAGTPAKRLTFSNLWTWITTKLGALTSITAGGAWAFSSTTRPTSSGTGTPANNSLITRDDGDLRYDRHVAQQQGRANFSWANGAFNLYNAGSNSQFQAVPSRMRIIKSIFVEWGLTAEALNTNFEVRVFWNSRKANNIAGGGSAQIISGTVSLVAGSGDAWRYRFTAENITIDSVAVNDADGTGFYTIDIRVRNDTGGSLTTSTDVRHLAFIEFGVV